MPAAKGGARGGARGGSRGRGRGNKRTIENDDSYSDTKTPSAKRPKTASAAGKKNESQSQEAFIEVDEADDSGHESEVVLLKSQKQGSRIAQLGSELSVDKMIIDLESDEPLSILRKFRSKSEAPDGFPRFRNGNVYIQLVEGDPKHCYTFDKARLSNQSEVLAKMLVSPLPEELDVKLAKQFKKRERLERCFSLEYRSGIGAWVLEKVVSCHPSICWPFTARSRAINGAKPLSNYS
jgi:hypothetical protein